jgi:hypothetical protein
MVNSTSVEKAATPENAPAPVNAAASENVTAAENNTYQPESSSLTAEKMACIIRAKYANAGMDDPSEEDIQEVINKITENKDDNHLAKYTELIKEGKAVEEALELAKQLGIQGAIALFRSVILNCPGLSKKRQNHYLRGIVLPEGATLEGFGTVHVELAATGEREKKSFHLQSGECGPEYVFADEFGELLKELDEKETETVIGNVGTIILFIRQQYISILKLNHAVIDEIQAKLGDIDITLFRLDQENNTLYFRPDSALCKKDDAGETLPWLPMAGVFAYTR